MTADVEFPSERTCGGSGYVEVGGADFQCLGCDDCPDVFEGINDEEPESCQF